MKSAMPSSITFEETGLTRVRFPWGGARRMIQLRGTRMIGSALFILLGLGWLVYVSDPDAVRAQFGDERRRGDLSPIQLPGGSVVQFKSFSSACLGTDQPYSIFLPPSYSKDSARAYPVVYFLHGLNNDHTSWTMDRYGNLQNRL